MADHNKNALLAAARALDEVIIPAIDLKDPLAHEQARIISKYLKLLESRFDYVYDRVRFELMHYCNLGAQVQGEADRVSPTIAGELKATVKEARLLLARAGSSMPAMDASTKRLSALLAAVVRTCADADEGIRSAIEHAVLDASKELLDAQRSWFLPQGWDRAPEAVPHLDSAFTIGLHTDPAVRV